MLYWFVIKLKIVVIWILLLFVKVICWVGIGWLNILFLLLLKYGNWIVFNLYLFFVIDNVGLILELFFVFSFKFYFLFFF